MYARVCACHCRCDIMSMYFSVSLFVFMSACEYGVHDDAAYLSIRPIRPTPLDYYIRIHLAIFNFCNKATVQ